MAATKPAVGERFDAFISYSHALDGRLAPALQFGLHQFAKPWYRLRALRVFRDEASLSANPALWTSIAAALDGSRWFLLLASPEAARSGWVGREVERWCSTRPRDHILLVLTGGDIAWDGERGDFAWDRTTALPGALRGMLAEEPRFVDLRWASHEDHVSLANPRFLDAVADVSATLQGRPKDELAGEDVRQHRRTRRVVKGVIATLTLLLLGAVLASVIAVRQRDRAKAQARIATSRLLAAEAVGKGDGELDVAALLAAQAWALEDNAQTRGALVQVLLRSPSLVAHLPGTEGASALAHHDGTHALAVGAESGRLTLWDLRTLRLIRTIERAHAGGIATVAFSSDGHLVVTAGKDGSVRLWDAATGQRARELRVDGAVMTAVFSRDDRRVVAVTEKGDLSVWRASDGTRLQEISGVSFANPRVVLEGDGRLVVGDGQGEVVRWKLSEGMTPKQTGDRYIGAGQPFISAYTSDLRLFAGLAGGPTAYVTDVSTGEFLHPDNLVGPTLGVDAMAFSDDGAYLATAGEGRVVLWDVKQNRAVDPPLNGVMGTARAVAFARKNEVVAVAGERGVAVWQRPAHVLVHALEAVGRQPLAEVPRVLQGAASAAFSPDGRRLAWSVNTGARSWMVVWDLDREVELSRAEALSVVGFSADGREVAGKAEDQNEFVVVEVDGGTRRLEARLPPEIVRARPASTDLPWSAESHRGLGASIAADGLVTLWDVGSRQPIARVGVPGAYSFSPLVFDPAGRWLAVASPGGGMSLVDVAVDVWRARVCALAARSLSDEEWTRYAGTKLDTPSACP